MIDMTSIMFILKTSCQSCLKLTPICRASSVVATWSNHGSQESLGNIACWSLTRSLLLAGPTMISDLLRHSWLLANSVRASPRIGWPERSCSTQDHAELLNEWTTAY